MVTVRRLSLLIVMLGLLGPVASLGQSRIGTTSATFLTIGTGARGSALGHAYTAVVNGPGVSSQGSWVVRDTLVFIDGASPTTVGFALYTPAP